MDVLLGEFMPKLYIMGDSTAAKKDDKSRPETGWGECFDKYLSSGWTLDNRAVNGRSTRLVLSNGDFFHVLEDLNAGDAVLIQYGHNESKEDEERHTEPWTSFRDNLKFMAASIRKKNADVYFLTPIARRHFVSGSLVDTHGDYVKAMKAEAEESSVPLVDMTSATEKLLSEAGDENSKEFFMNFGPGLYENYPDGLSDDTHLRPKGAEAVALLTAKALSEYKPSFLLLS